VVQQQQKGIVDGSDANDLAFDLFNFRVPGLRSEAMKSPEWIAVSPMRQMNGAATFSVHFILTPSSRVLQTSDGVSERCQKANRFLYCC
jgi:hypothetical protein